MCKQQQQPVQQAGFGAKDAKTADAMKSSPAALAICRSLLRVGLMISFCSRSGTDAETCAAAAAAKAQESGQGPLCAWRQDLSADLAVLLPSSVDDAVTASATTYTACVPAGLEALLAPFLRLSAVAPCLAMATVEACAAADERCAYDDHGDHVSACYCC
jgi:hypothetical protein